ncbi:hypothetical protein [Xanthomonas campestris]|uniref:hypothetical protein n=1 Tax=Xanthomonas campestris TaxID=339 RepID=UPI0023790CCC|nr:hypothetical protein [Xanthomonas campestris]WDJ75253.1 hypothetical protein JH282_12320 [Xanthomonas campestris pv. campestris]
MPITDAAFVRSFFDLPDDKVESMEAAEFLANFPSGAKIDWATLLESDRVLIVSEAGMGKTFECKRTAESLWNEGRAAFFVELSALASRSIEDGFCPEEQARFDSWKSAQTEHAIFFLDSIDELKLTLSSFDRAIKSVARSLAGHLGRVTIVVTTRPIPVDREVIAKHLPVPVVEAQMDPEIAFASVAMREKKPENQEGKAPTWRNVALAPLREKQMREMAKTAGVTDLDRLFEAISSQNAHDFARRPLDFLELCGDWKENGYIRSHREQVDTAIEIRLRPNKDRDERVSLEPIKAREGAARLAFAALLGRKFNIWHGQGGDRASGDGALGPAEVLPDWTGDQLDTLLERGLFGFANYGRVRFYHRSAIEFLAAERLRQLREKGLPDREVARLLFADTQEGERIVKPAMRPVVAWLAPHDAFIRGETIKHEPELLLHAGDPESLDVPLRRAALEGYVGRFGKGGWRGQAVPSLQVERFASKDLMADVARLWSSGIENPEVRETLLGLIGCGQMKGNADLAHEVAVDALAEIGSRISALVALSRLDDPRLPALLDEIASGVPDCSPLLVQRAVIEFFPSRMSPEQLMKIFARQGSKSRTYSGPITYFTNVVERSPFDADKLLLMQKQLSALVNAGLTWDRSLYRLQSKRQDLVPALLALCSRRLSDHRCDAALAKGIALSLLLTVDDYEIRGDVKGLRAALSDAPDSVRSGVFWAQDAIARKYHPKSERSTQPRLHHLQWEGGYHPVLQRDELWVLAAIADPQRRSGDRALALEVAIEWTPHKSDPDRWIAQLSATAAGAHELEARVAALGTAYVDRREPSDWERKNAAYMEANRRKHAKDIASWRQFHRELCGNPDVAFSDVRVENTLWNFWKAMKNERSAHSQAGWNRGFIERMLSKDLADRFQKAFAAAWRRETPTLQSERNEEDRNTTRVIWGIGLAGIYAEAEDPAWAARLSAGEVKLACRYALLELNRLPPWLEQLATRHPAAVDSVIGRELSEDLGKGADPHGMLLQYIRRSTEPVAHLLLPRVRAWAHKVAVKMRLTDVQRRNMGNAADFLLVHGSPEDTALLRDAAIAATTGRPNPKNVDLWLPILGRLDADAFVDTLERLSRSITPARHSKVVNWLGAIFGHHASLGLSSMSARPDLILRLLRLTHRHVRSEDDDSAEGVRSVGNRENAEYARSSLFNALMEMKGEDALRAKISLSGDPEVSRYRDRIIAIRREKLAEELDAEVLTEREVRELEKNFEISPRTRWQMAHVLAGRLDEIEDYLRQDVSPREAWVGFQEERLLRRALSAEFERLARDSYIVAQEGVTGDEKETDIRLVSKSDPSIQAVIELKVGENKYSIASFQKALREQLMEKYLLPEQRRVGALVISWRGNKTWDDPVTGEEVRFDEVIRRLNSEAQELAATLGSDAFLAVRGLDLSPPKFAAKAKTIKKASKQPAKRRKT